MKLQQSDSFLELYIHIPFCVKKCDYCDFLSGPADVSRQEAYVQALLDEIHFVKEGKEKKVSSIFIGGGTPSILDPILIKKVLDKLYEEFFVAPDAEITIEANPGTLCKEKVLTYKKAGINRISLGLQSTDDRELAILGRIHTYREFRESFDLARKAGFSNINVDLMCAIPEQSYPGWIRNLRTVAELGPEHISAYSLIVEEGTPFATRELKLPDEDTEYAMYEDTAGVLREYGYHQYEISNYAKEGFACRHNSGYWKRTNYLGFGLGAASLYEKRRFSNTRNMKEYLRGSCRPETLRREEICLSREDEMGEFMFLGLRMTAGILKEDFFRQFGIPLEEIYGDVVQKYKKLGLLQEEKGRLFLTRQGIHVSNTVMADFLIE